jgi:triosephosphate isomerase
MTQHKKLAAGNWKMNGLAAALSEVTALLDMHPDPACEVLLCPPATLLSRMSDMTAGGAIVTGGQDCHATDAGAHTGDISARMLGDAGAAYVIVGHSERRADHAETDALVRAKAKSGLEAGLRVIICVGETLAQREAGQTSDVIGAQLAGSIPDGVSAATCVLAYEPVWAIGTGKVPSLAQIGEVHDFIRTRLESRFGDAVGGSVRLLYGGSVKASNAAEIFAVANVDGALVGGASLKAADFSPIIKALEASG